MGKRLDGMASYKHEFAQKSEFLYKKIQDNSKIFREELEGFATEIVSLKQTVSINLKNLNKES